MGELIYFPVKGGEMKGEGVLASIWRHFVYSTAGQRAHRWSWFFKKHRGGSRPI